MNNLNSTLEILESGSFKDAYLLYSRKSTDEVNNQKNSLDYQKSIGIKFAQEEGLKIAKLSIKGFSKEGVISERHSGFKEDDAFEITEEGQVMYSIERPKFQQMIKLLNQGMIKGVICLCWDRISRNKSDDVVIRKLIRRKVDFRFVYAKYDNSSSGALHMDIDEMFSHHHSRVTSEKVKAATYENRSKGKCTYKAPLGYLNTGSIDHKPMDSQRGPIIKKMFELYSTGEWSLSDLERFGAKQGLRFKPARRKRTQEEILDDDIKIEDIPKVSRPVKANHIGHMLRNKFYIGQIMGSEGQWVQSTSHQPLIDIETFFKVQMLLGQKNVSVHYTKKVDLPLRGLIRCEKCKRIYSPYKKKGKIYFRAKCRKECNNTQNNFNFSAISNEIYLQLKSLHFTDNQIEKLENMASTQIALLETRRLNELENATRQKKTLREDLSYLRENKLALLRSGVYSPISYAEQEKQIYSEIQGLMTQELISEEAMHETMKDVIELSEQLKRLPVLYNKANWEEKDEIVKSLFSELFYSENGLICKARIGIKCFQLDKRGSCCPKTWFSEFYNNREYIKSIGLKLKAFGRKPL